QRIRSRSGSSFKLLRRSCGPALREFQILPGYTVMGRRGSLLIASAAAVLTVMCGGGTSTPTTPTTTCTLPTAPSLMALASGTTVSLNWSTVSGATDYFLTAGTASGQAQSLSVSVNNTTYAWTDVFPGTYYLRVRARNACGTGPNSNEVSVTVQSSGLT